MLLFQCVNKIWEQINQSAIVVTQIRAPVLENIALEEQFHPLWFVP